MAKQLGGHTCCLENCGHQFPLPGDVNLWALVQCKKSNFDKKEVKASARVPCGFQDLKETNWGFAVKNSLNQNKGNQSLKILQESLKMLCSKSSNNSRSLSNWAGVWYGDLCKEIP